eukprot:2309811-Amphidinium_carterae.1
MQELDVDGNGEVDIQVLETLFNSTDTDCCPRESPPPAPRHPNHQNLALIHISEPTRPRLI